MIYQTQMNSKRGQVTIFIVIGILMLALTAGIAYVVKTSATEDIKTEEGELNINFISSFVENCLKKSTIEGMYQVFAQGGYYEFPLDLTILEFAEEDSLLEVPIYFQNKKAELPTISFIEKEVAKATEKELLHCIDEFKSFVKQGYAITFNEPKAEIRFSDRTNIMLDFPLTIIKDAKETKLTTFASTVPFNFKDKYNYLKDYFTKQEKDPDYFLIGDISSKAYENDFVFGFKQFGNSGSEVLVYLIYDENLKKEPVIYSFGLYFNWVSSPGEKLEIREPSLVLKKLSAWNIEIPGTHTYQVEAEGEDIMYLVEPDSLQIDNAGKITLNTADFPNDEYLYYVIIKDGLNQQTAGPLIININANSGKLPVIEPIEKQYANVGEEFYYKVNVLNEGLLLFTSDSYLFEIDKKTGEIKFIPREENKGIYSIRVDVENGYGRTWQRWELEIK